MKAVYQNRGWTFRYTHDLDELITGLKSKGLVIPPEVIEADSLSNFAWETRYPGLSEPVTQDDHQEALRKAGIVLAWAEKQME